MRVVVLAGGLGTRLAEETDVRPKPMIDIGGRPILWHILQGYSAFGFSHFVIALGFKGDAIKQFFLEYSRMNADLTVKTRTGDVNVQSEAEDWTVDLVGTGSGTETGGRLGRLRAWLPDEEFCLTYGDSVSNVDIRKVVDFHRQHGRSVTVTAVRPPSRFGGLVLDGDRVRDFTEKPQIGEGWVNGGYMVVNRTVLDRISGDEVSFERDVLESLASEGELMAYRHEGYWQPMDTVREVRLLRALWEGGNPPWQTW